MSSMNLFDKVVGINSVSKEIHKKVLLARSKQRIQARSILEMDYQALRDVCTELPPRGRIARSQILKATLSKIQKLQEEVNRRRAQQMTAWQLQHARPPEEAGRRVNSQTCSLSGPCKIHLDKRTEQPAQFRGGSLPEVQILWESLQPGQSQHRLPGFRPHQAIQPYMAHSPPLQKRLWMPTMMEATATPAPPTTFWRPFYEPGRTIPTSDS